MDRSASYKNSSLHGLVLAMCLLLSGHLLSRASNPATSGQFFNLSFPQSAAPNVNTVYIPFTQVGQLIMVEAAVDTLSGYFIVDTGSERLVVNHAHYTPQGTALSVTSAGNTGLVDFVKGENIDSLKMELLVIKNLFAHIVDLSHIETKKHIRLIGILGYDVFKDFELFIDFPQRRIVLYRLDRRGQRIDPLTRWEIPSDSIKFTLRKHLIQVVVEINHVDVKMILDSGAELNLIDRHINRKVLDNFTIIKRVNLVGVGKNEVEVMAGVLKGVRCGQQFAEKMNTLLTNLDVINTSFDAQSDGVLGYEFLKDRRTMINYTTRKIYFFNPIRS